MLIKVTNTFKNIDWKISLLVLSIICFLLVSFAQFYTNKQQGEKMNVKIELISSQLESNKSDVKNLNRLISDTEAHASNAWSEAADANSGIGDLQSSIDDIKSAVDAMSYEIERVRRSLNY